MVTIAFFLGQMEHLDHEAGAGRDGLAVDLEDDVDRRVFEPADDLLVVERGSRSGRATWPRRLKRLAGAGAGGAVVIGWRAGRPRALPSPAGAAATLPPFSSPFPRISTATKSPQSSRTATLPTPITTKSMGDLPEP